MQDSLGFGGGRDTKELPGAGSSFQESASSDTPASMLEPAKGDGWGTRSSPRTLELL